MSALNDACWHAGYLICCTCCGPLTALHQSGPVLVSLAAFGVFYALGNDLTAAVAFPALALFNLLRFPM